MLLVLVSAPNIYLSPPHIYLGTKSYHYDGCGTKVKDCNAVVHMRGNDAPLTDIVVATEKRYRATKPRYRASIILYLLQDGVVSVEDDKVVQLVESLLMGSLIVIYGTLLCIVSVDRGVPIMMMTLLIRGRKASKIHSS